MFLKTIRHYFSISWIVLRSLYIFLTLYFLILIIVNTNSGDTQYAISIVLFSYVLVPIFIVCGIIFFYDVIKYFYKKYKNNIFYFLFFTFYFLFFIFYFLFFIFYSLESLEYNANILYLYFMYFFIIFTILFIFNGNKIYKYLFAIFVALSDLILIKFYLLNNLFPINIQDYYIYVYNNSMLKWIPLSFAIIQLIIEAYYFYQKEKPKWERYKRMQKYKQSKV